MDVIGGDYYKYTWTVDGLVLQAKKKAEDWQRLVSVMTHQGQFIETLDEDGNVVYEGGDGEWYDVELPKKGSRILRHKILPDPELSKKELDKNRNTVTRTLLHDAPYSLDIPEGLNDFILWLQNKLLEVPKECRASATAEIDTEYEYGESYPRFTIEYKQKESDEEVIERVQIARERRRIQEAKEKAELNALKEKYEPID